VRLLALTVFAGGMLLIAAPEAHAGTCWDNGCDGQDPMVTGCYEDAYLLKRVTIPVYWPSTGDWVKGGTLDVLYSPGCASQWTQIVPSPGACGVGFCPIEPSIYRWAQGDHYEYYAGENPRWGDGAESLMVGAHHAQATSRGCLTGYVGDTCVSTSA